VAGREDEAIAIRPVRIGGVELHDLGEQYRRDIGDAHRQARMAGIGLLDRVHCQGADGIGHVVGRRGIGHLCSLAVRSQGRKTGSFEPVGPNGAEA